MNGELAQIIALVAHGNQFLSQPEDAAVPDLSTHSTFQFVSSLQFARYNNRADVQGTVVAERVSDWFIFLRSLGVKRLWNIAFAWQHQDLPEHIADSFSGAIPRAIQADLPQCFELWYPQWRTGGQERQPWLVQYRSLMFPTSHVVSYTNLIDVRTRLRQAILRAESFARRTDVNTDRWAELFSNALRMLDSARPEMPYHPDILPEQGYSLDARQILAAAMYASVFGGMGTWNDLSFSDRKVQLEYEEVTRELYDAVKLAAVLSSNSFAL